MIRSFRLLAALPLLATSVVADDTFLTFEEAGPDFAVQGEYVGEVKHDGTSFPIGFQVIALGDHKFDGVSYPGGLPGAGWTCEEKFSAHGETKDGETKIVDDEHGHAIVKDGKAMLFSKDGKQIGTLNKVERKSPTLGEKAPAGAIVLFDGTSADQFERGKIIMKDLLAADCETKEKFGDYSMEIPHILDKWFVHENSLVPLSRRPSIYRYMVDVEVKKKGYNGILEIGKRYENDVAVLERNWLKVKRMQSASNETNTLSLPICSTLKTEAISYQIFSLYALGRSREAARLRTRNRFLLNQFSSTVLEIEKHLKEVDDLPEHDSMYSLKKELADAHRIYLRSRMEWPFPVQQWYDKMLQSQTTWKQQQEFLFICISL